MPFSRYGMPFPTCLIKVWLGSNLYPYVLSESYTVQCRSRTKRGSTRWWYHFHSIDLTKYYQHDFFHLFFLLPFSNTSPYSSPLRHGREEIQRARASHAARSIANSAAEVRKRRASGSSLLGSVDPRNAKKKKPISHIFIPRKFFFGGGQPGRGEGCHLNSCIKKNILTRRKKRNVHGKKLFQA